MKIGSRYLLGVLVLCLASMSYAADAAKIKKLVADFDKIQVFKAIMAGQGPQPLPDDPNNPYPGNPPDQNPPHPPYPPGNCPPSGGFPKGCIEAVCNHVSRFDCDEQSELAEVSRNCRNVNANCVNAICNRVSRFECDEKVELFTVTGMCRGLLDISCIDYVCSRLSRFECDELSELRRVADQCR
ncbi:hypothetical protein [Bdellovibrio svalbardensis]|uniref:Uncharacterized protein n=1 Tax=Bdellovibrio svalbardensis TaxID=2972972 RepID=A0ABT6DKN5_9BACT|nr:hypothetical protein [Bdellovibrio svalbardensis]MDG0817422.1 hypothetical protein [Bdellovibrio svalbardensis]